MKANTPDGRIHREIEGGLISPALRCLNLVKGATVSYEMEVDATGLAMKSQDNGAFGAGLSFFEAYMTSRGCDITQNELVFLFLQEMTRQLIHDNEVRLDRVERANDLFTKLVSNAEGGDE